MKVVIILACIAATVFAAPGNNGSWRIVGGDGEASTAPNFSPHQVSIRINGAHTCSGSILDGTTILTAAHCVVGSDPTTIKIYADNNKLSAQTQYQVASFICHEDYDSWDIKNDIAIIKLTSPIPVGTTDPAKAVELRQSDITAEADVTLYGWGTTTNPGSLSDALQFITLKTISVKDCIDKMPDKVGPTELCAIAGTGKGACHGDAGGPLVAFDGTVVELVGILSWGIPCGQGYPDVFTRVYSFLDWIKANRN